MKRLILADVKSINLNGKSVGHYFTLAQNYLDLFSNICQVKIAGGPIFKTRFKNDDIISLPYDFYSSENWIISKWRVLMNCKALFNRSMPYDIIVIQQSGLSTAIMGIALFAKKNRNIYIIPYDLDALSSVVKRIIYWLAKPKIKGLLCPNKKIADEYKKSGCIVTDYIYPKDKIENQIPFSERKYDIAIVGRINQDKGVVEAVKYLAGTQYKVVIAGKGDSRSIETELENYCNKDSVKSSNIELHIGYVSEIDYYMYIRNAKFVMLNYRGDYEDRSSGVVLDTLFSGTPVLGRRCNALNFVEKECVGYLFDDINNLDLDDVINKNKYEKYQRGILVFVEKQKNLKNKIIDYLHLNDK